MSDRALPLLEKLKEQFGGSLRQSRPETEKWEAATQWSTQGRAAANLLRQVGRHLVLKHEQALVLISLDELIASLEPTPNGLGRKWTPEALSQAKAFKASIHRMNRKGPARQDAQLAGGVWRTWQRSLTDPTGWEVFSETWPRSVMTRSAIAFQRAPLVPLTDATESGLLPTPEASNTKAVALRSGDRSPRNFLAPIPTPRPCSGLRSSGMNRTEIMRALEKWPTPNAGEAKQSTKTARRAERRLAKPNLQITLTEVAGGALNPEFVEWLMGYPKGHTEVE